MATNDDLEPPVPGEDDMAHMAARGLVSLLPGGSLLLEFFNKAIAPPIERRQEKWRAAMADAVRELKSRGIQDEDLRSNESFTTTVIQATRIAATVHQQEKLDALRNAVLNAALPHAPDDSLQQMFLGWVDQFTVWHLRALSVFDDPEGWFRARRRTFQHFQHDESAQLLRDAYPELKRHEALPELVIHDLRTAGVLTPAKPPGVVGVGRQYEARTTQVGRQFLKFITEPQANDADRPNAQ